MAKPVAINFTFGQTISDAIRQAKADRLSAKIREDEKVYQLKLAAINKGIDPGKATDLESLFTEMEKQPEAIARRRETEAEQMFETTDIAAPTETQLGVSSLSEVFGKEGFRPLTEWVNALAGNNQKDATEVEEWFASNEENIEKIMKNKWRGGAYGALGNQLSNVIMDMDKGLNTWAMGTAPQWLNTGIKNLFGLEDGTWKALDDEIRMNEMKEKVTNLRRKLGITDEQSGAYGGLGTPHRPWDWDEL